MTDLHRDEAAAKIKAAQRSGKIPIVRTFFDEATFTATHVIHDPATRTAAIIDSVLDFDQPSGRTSHASADAIIDYVRTWGLTVEWQIETQAHADHLSAAPYLQENMTVKLSLHDMNPVAIQLPQRATLEVVETEPVTKGQTASSSYKPAILSNGVRTAVPPHIGTGTRIVVMTEDGSYVERAKD